MKRYASLIAIASLLLYSTDLLAQRFSYGAEAGTSIPSPLGGSSGNPLKSGTTFKLGSNLGIYAAYNPSSKYSFSLGIDYVSQGGTYELNYLLVPLFVQKFWKLNDRYRIFAGGGPFGGLFLAANRDVIQKPNAFNWGMGGMVGLSYIINRNSSVFFELGSDYGLVRLQKPTIHKKGHYNVALFRVGYTFTSHKIHKARHYRNKYHEPFW